MSGNFGSKMNNSAFHAIGKFHDLTFLMCRETGMEIFYLSHLRSSKLFTVLILIWEKYAI